MSRELFGTDGVRGIAGRYPLDTAGAHQIGKAIAIQFAQVGDTVVIGADTRESSTDLVQAVASGLRSMGVNVVFAGVIATPGLAYVTQQHEQFVAGVMITASHNPYQYNGIKVFASDGGKLSDETEAKLNDLIRSEIADRGTGTFEEKFDLRTEYQDFLVASVQGQNFANMQLAVDMANGATSGYAAAVFEKVGARVTPLFDAPNGKNINQACGATHVQALQKKVVENKLDAGIAFDGDADRLMLVDAQGRVLTGDHSMYILAVAYNIPVVVATVMSNLGLENSLATKGITLERTAVGDRYVLERLEHIGAQLGGEQSGHIIMPTIHKTGDGLLAALQILRAVQTSGKSLQEWRDELVLLPQALVNIELGDKTLLESPDIKTYISTQLSVLGNQGRLLIRPSGTEPLVRVMVEAADAQVRAEKISSELRALLGHEALKRDEVD